MRMKGVCDFCETEGDWEAGIFYDQKDVKKRPKDWAAAFPSNMERLPEGCTFRTEDCEKYGVETALACPKCCRRKNDKFTPKKVML